MRAPLQLFPHALSPSPSLSITTGEGAAAPAPIRWKLVDLIAKSQSPSVARLHYRPLPGSPLDVELPLRHPAGPSIYADTTPPCVVKLPLGGAKAEAHAIEPPLPQAAGARVDADGRPCRVQLMVLILPRGRLAKRANGAHRVCASARDSATDPFACRYTAST
jgi:hypothetical protein